ncbi:MAG: recombinase family protein [Lachnospiraceae bacterium]|nr:recombinase family protein [Lachnospiraceae bacterium]
MARKSRKAVFVAENAAAEVKGYKTALYVRLSREDERKIESDTVENQIEFLKDYIGKDPSLVLVDEYVDRHVTGTKFDRPEFNRMISDIRSRRINCVVVKDLSRLGRNYLEAGDYIEKIFPFFGVRFIAVTDNYDSLTSNPTEDGLVVPLKNLINEAYAKDISKKIYTSFENQFRQGVFFATTAAYGYKKDPDDPHMVLVDEDVRDIVIRIFTEYVGGKSMAQIARDLNMDEIPAPSVYWQQKDVIHVDKYTNLWDGKQIRNILQNPIYTGDVRIGKTHKCYFKGITRAKERDGYYVENHHEAIIDHETFERAQELRNAKRKEYFSVQGKNDEIRNRKPDFLQGYLYCGHCGNKMNMYRKTTKLVNGVGHYSTYVCRRSATYGPDDPQKNVKAENLEEIVLKLIQAHIAVYVDTRDRLRALNRNLIVKGKKAELELRLSELEKRKDKVNELIRNTYEDFSDGVLSEDEYLEMKSGYVEEVETLLADMAEIKGVIETYSTAYAGGEAVEDAFSKYIGVKELSRGLVETFIKKITCYSKERFEVVYTFSDELQELMDLAEQRGADAS